MTTRPVPHVAQLEETGCGAAALTSVLQWFGRSVTLPEMSVACDVGRDGVNMATLVQVAAAQGVRGTGLRAAVDQDGVRAICGVTGPVIALLRGGHFVVVDGLDRRGRVQLCDPATGRSTCSIEDFVGRFTGIVLRFELIGPQAAVAPQRRPLRERTLPRWWRDEAAGVRLLLTSAATATVLGAGCTIASALLVRHWFDPAARRWLAVAAVAAVISGVAARLLTAQALETSSRRRTTAVVDQLLTRRPDFFHRRFAAELAGRPQRIDSAVIAMTGLFADTLVQVVTVTALVCAAAILSPVAATVLVGGALIGSVLVLVGRRSDAGFAEAELAAGSRRDSEVITGLTTLETVKAEASGEKLVARWRAAADLQRATRRRMTARAQLRGRTAALVDGTALVASLLISASLAPTSLLAVLVLGSVLQQRVGALARSSVDLHSVSAALRLADDIRTAPAVTAPADTAPAGTALDGGTSAGSTTAVPAPRSAAPSVVLRDVRYGHQRFRAPVLSGVDLDLGAGGWAFVVGSSGCGKSTLAGLVAGTAAPWAGQILVGGRTPVAGDGRVCTVPQRPVVLDGTVADNLTLGTPFDDETLWDALRQVELDLVVRRRGGLDAPVEEGGRNFSGGERQRIALARALVRAPSLLILDEATSNLEPALEERIVRRLRTLPSTVLMIAHRLPERREDDLVICLPDIVSGTRPRPAPAAAAAPSGRDAA